MVKSILTNASSVASTLQDYVRLADLEATGVESTSSVTGSALGTARTDIEWFMLRYAQSANINDANICGIGFLGEKNVFSPNDKDYSFYIDDEHANSKTFQTCGTYEEYSQNDFFTVPKSNDLVFYSTPHAYNGENVITVSYPVDSNGVFQGVFFLNIKVESFNMLISESNRFSSMLNCVTNSDGVLVYDSTTTDSLGVSLSEFFTAKDFSELKNNFAKGETFYIHNTNTNNGVTKNVLRVFCPIQLEDSTFWAQSMVELDDLNKDVTAMTWLLIIAGVVGCAIIITVLARFISHALKPIEGVVEETHKLDAGDLDINVKLDRKDEIGYLANEIDNIASNLRIIIRDMLRTLSELAKGNFQIEAQYYDYYIGEYKKIYEAIGGIIRNMSETLGEIGTAADQVNSGAEQVSSAAQGLSQGATEQASSVQELSATMAEIAEKVKQNAKEAEKAQQLSHEAGMGVVESNEKMKALSTAMEDITNKSNEIGKIIKTIDDIAFQTNILALNAAVEAARAGAAGKGFAVVADEVRNLAQKSAEAAKNTTALIDGAVTAIARGAKITEETAQALLGVADKSSTVDSLIEDISVASQAQSEGVSQVSLGIDQISAVVQTNSATAEECAAASEELSSQANMLRNLVSQFKLFDLEAYNNGTYQPPREVPAENEHTNDMIVSTPSDKGEATISKY